MFRYTYPSSSSAEKGRQTPAFPEVSLELFSHVSDPGSPLRGIVWNTHFFFPLRTSNASTSPFTFVLLTRPPGVNAAPTITVSREITTGELLPIFPIGVPL